MTGVRPLFLAALAVAVLGAAAAFALPKILNSIRADDIRANLAAATAAEQRIKVPADFIRFGPSHTPKCVAWRCYLVKKPTNQVVPSLRDLFKSFGAQAKPNPGQGQLCSTTVAISPDAVGWCSYTGRIDHVLIDASVLPYEAFQDERLTSTPYSEVDLDAPYPPGGFCSIPGWNPTVCGS